MDSEYIARLDEVLKKAQSDEYGKDQAFSEFRAVLIEGLVAEPFCLSRDGAAAWMLCEMWLNPEEGVVKGGGGYEHLDFRPLNQRRVRLFQQYGLPLTRFAGMSLEPAAV